MMGEEGDALLAVSQKWVVFLRRLWQDLRTSMISFAPNSTKRKRRQKGGGEEKEEGQEERRRGAPGTRARCRRRMERLPSCSTDLVLWCCLLAICFLLCDCV